MLNIVLIGFGYWGPNVARNIYESKLCNLYSICDLRHERLNLARDKYMEQTRYTTDYSVFLSDPLVDAIAIVVETESHFRIAKEAIIAGKHVFIEKPITANVEEAEELKQLAKKHHVIIHVDHIMVFHSVIKRIKQMIVSGEMGELIYFDSSRLNLGKIKNDVSAMWDLAVHDLAVIDYLLDGKSPDTITAMGEKFWSRKESLTFLTLKYGKFLAHLKSSWISPIKERRIIVAGTRKMVVFDDMRSMENFIIYDKGFSPDQHFENIEYLDYAAKAREGDALIPNIPYEDALLNSVEHFVNVIEKGITQLAGVDQAIRIIKALETAELILNPVIND
jgi:predicted dehydrogenase